MCAAAGSAAADGAGGGGAAAAAAATGSDVDECDDPSLNDCSQECENLPGGYLCSRKDGFKLKEGSTTKCVGRVLLLCGSGWGGEPMHTY